MDNKKYAYLVTDKGIQKIDKTHEAWDAYDAPLYDTLDGAMIHFSEVIAQKLESILETISDLKRGQGHWGKE